MVFERFPGRRNRRVGRAIALGSSLLVLAGLTIAAGAAVKQTFSALVAGPPTWSPNGLRILMYRYDGRDNEIAMMNANGTRQTFLTADPASDLDPSWVPVPGGGVPSKVVYSSNRVANNEITLRDLAVPGSVTNTTNDAGADTDPDYRPA